MVSRRSFVGLGVQAAAAAVTVGRVMPGAASALRSAMPAESEPRAFARVRDFSLVASAERWSVGTQPADNAWLFNGQLPGPELRVTEGDIVRVTLRNQLPEPTSIHWHGIPVPFGMDGVPELTQQAVQPGGTFTYEFPATVPGTFWYHSHFGYQFERGLFGAIIIEPKRESLTYDREYTVVFDDWLRNVDHPMASASPYNMTVGGVVMGSMAMEMDDMAGTPDGPGGDVPDTTANQQRHSAAHGTPRREPVFDAYTINGHSGAAIPPLVVRRGERVRLRLVNASTATVVPIYLAGHRLTITHTDGQPVAPLTADAFPIGMGERVDVVFVADNPGVWRFGSTDARHRALGLGTTVRYEGIRPETSIAEGTVPRIDSRPYRAMEGTAEVSVRRVDRSYAFDLWRQGPALWTIGDKAYPDFDPLVVTAGERIRVRIRNMSMFAHPIHLHGHFFDLVRPYGAFDNVARPLRKDTLTLYHMDEHTIEFTAGNPGPRWLLHCHNQYHHVAGMATEVKYI